MRFTTKLLTILLVLAALAGVSTPAYAQSNITTTTLSAAITTNRATTFTVASATGWNASTFPGNIYYAYVDHELMLVRAISGTTITVDRGAQGTNATPHANSAVIFTGAAGSNNYLNNGQTFVTGGPFVQTAPAGSCTRSLQATLPVIAYPYSGIGPQTENFYNCNNGQWVAQTNPADNQNTPLVAACNISIGGVAYGSVGTNTTGVANKRWTSTMYVPYSFYATGIQFLTGGTATTDKITSEIHDAGGFTIANSAAAGVLLSGGGNTFLSVPFTSKTLITGPALYYIATNTNGTNAGDIQTIPTLTFNNVLTAGTTSITFGTFPSFTPPTTFTANVGPVGCLY